MTDRLIRLPEVCYIVGMSKATIYRRMDSGTFPRPVKVGPSSNRWWLSDIDGWLRDLRGGTDGGIQNYIHREMSA